MNESPDSIHGRMKEGAHLAGYGLARAMENLKWLLEGGKYSELSSGYSNVNDFLRDTKEAFSLLNINPEERKQIAQLVKELQPQASQRAIADMVGVNNATIAADLGTIERNRAVETSTKTREKQAESVEFSTPQPWTADDSFDPSKRAKAHVANNSGENEWYTPPEYIESCRTLFGGIDLDPASSAEAQSYIMAGKYYTKEDDGLKQDWFGHTWMNPPYAKELIEPFVDKLVYHFYNQDVPEAVVLVNNATETSWFGTLIKAACAVVFTEGRIKFIDKNGNRTGAPLQGQALVYLGSAPESFLDEFTQYGWGAMIYGKG